MYGIGAEWDTVVERDTTFISCQWRYNSTAKVHEPHLHVECLWIASVWLLKRINSIWQLLAISCILYCNIWQFSKQSKPSFHILFPINFNSVELLMFLKIFFDDAMIDTSMIKDICMIFFNTRGRTGWSGVGYIHRSASFT